MPSMRTMPSHAPSASTPIKAGATTRLLRDISERATAHPHPGPLPRKGEGGMLPSPPEGERVRVRGRSVAAASSAETSRHASRYAADVRKASTRGVGRTPHLERRVLTDDPARDDQVREVDDVIGVMVRDEDARPIVG